MFLLAELKRTDPTAYKIMSVFKKHKIPYVEAAAILLELQAALTQE